MKSIKEKQILVKWAKAMNEPIDPALVEEVERYNQLQSEIKESVRSNTINDLFDASKVAVDIITKVNIEYPKPPTLEELLSIVQEEANELVQAQAAEESPVTEEVSVPDTPSTVTETVTEEIVEDPSDLISRAAKHIHKEVKSEEASFQQPQPTPAEKNFEAVQKKLKFLEQAIGKIAATGPGSGEVELKRLDDVDYASVSGATNNQVLSYNATSQLWVARSVTSGGGGIALTDLSVTVDTPSGNGNLIYDNNTGIFNFTPANLTPKANVTDLTTSNVVELTNLYFTNARAYTNVTQLGYITSSALSGYATNTQLATYATNSQLATYATNAQLATYATNAQLAVYATNAQLTSYATTTNVALKANIIDLTTANVTEVTNLYFTNARATAAVTNTSLSNVTIAYTPATSIGYGIVVNAANTQGGTGYADFLKVTNTSGGATNPNKSFRLSSAGGMEIINSAYTATLMSLSDAGAMSTALPYQVSGKQAVNGPAFSAYANATLQTISTGTLTKVLFQTEEFDTNSNYASSKFTPTVEGYYQLNAEVRLDGASGTGEMMIMLFKNGSGYKRGMNQSGTQIAANFWAMQVSTVVYANGTTDYFEVYVQQGSGGNVTVTAVNDPSITWFNGCMLRGA